MKLRRINTITIILLIVSLILSVVFFIGIAVVYSDLIASITTLISLYLPGIGLICSVQLLRSRIKRFGKA